VALKDWAEPDKGRLKVAEKWIGAVGEKKMIRRRSGKKRKMKRRRSLWKTRLGEDQWQLVQQICLQACLGWLCSLNVAWRDRIR